MKKTIDLESEEKNSITESFLSEKNKIGAKYSCVVCGEVYTLKQSFLNLSEHIHEVGRDCNHFDKPLCEHITEDIQLHYESQDIFLKSEHITEKITKEVPPKKHTFSIGDCCSKLASVYFDEITSKINSAKEKLLKKTDISVEEKLRILEVTQKAEAEVEKERIDAELKKLTYKQAEKTINIDKLIKELIAQTQEIKQEHEALKDVAQNLLHEKGQAKQKVDKLEESLKIKEEQYNAMNEFLAQLSKQEKDATCCNKTKAFFSKCCTIFTINEIKYDNPILNVPDLLQQLSQSSGLSMSEVLNNSISLIQSGYASTISQSISDHNISELQAMLLGVNYCAE